MKLLFCLIAVFVVLTSTVEAFQSTGRLVTPDRASLTMQYIPDGLTKAQWTALKKKEEDEKKAKGNLGALGKYQD